MNKLKRFLALVLAMSMMLTAVPFGVFAADDAPAITGTTDAPFKQGTGGSNSFRIPAMVTLSDGTLVAAADARWNTTYDGGGLDTMVAVSTDNGATWTHSFANYLGDNGNVYDGDASTCFIDPSLAVKTVNGVETIYMLCDLYPYGVALNGDDTQTAPSYDSGFDGDKLLLSADNHTSYGYYLDGTVIKTTAGVSVEGLTVDEHFNVTGTYNGTDYDTNLFFSDSPFKVARTGFLYLTTSIDKGATWSAPTLLPLKTSSEMVCLVGPGRGLVTNSGTIYFPAYSYKRVGSTETKYTVLIYSTDNGVTWQRSSSMGSPSTSSEATMVELDNGKIRTFVRNELKQLVYVDYNVETGNWGSSVQTGVYCNSDTELSAIKYSNTIDGKQVILVSAPAGPSNMTGTNDSNGQYRTSGKIFCGVVNNDDTRTMTWQDGSVAVTNVASGMLSGSTFTAEQGFFGYSCLTELDDTNNSVAILYEDSQNGWGAGTGYGYTMAYKTYSESDLETALGVTFDDDSNTDIEGDTPIEQYEKDITIKVGDTFTETVENIFVTDGSKEDDIVSVTWDGTEASTSTTYATATLGTNASYTGDTIDVADCLYTITVTGTNDTGKVCTITGTTSDGTTVYVYPGKGINPSGTANSDKAAGYPHATADQLPDGMTVEVRTGGKTGSFYLWSSTNAWGNPAWLQFDPAAYRWNRTETNGQTNSNLYLYRAATASEDSSEEIPGYVKVTSLDDVTSGGKYLIAASGNDGEMYIAYPSTSTASLYSQIAKVTGETETTTGTATAASTAVTITGKAVGKTTVEIGTGIIYNVTVSRDYDNEVNVELHVGETSETYTDTTGNYENDPTNVAPNSNIAEMTVTGVSGSTGTVTPLTSLTAGAANTFYIQVSEGTYLTDNCGTTTNINEAALWYAYYANSSYCTIRNVNTTYYLSVGYDGTVTTTQSTSYMKMSNGQLVGYYSNNAAGTPVTVSDASAASTDVIFKGIGVGSTVAYVGKTKYNITVLPQGVDNVVYVNLEVGETLTYTDTTGNYVGSDTIVQPDNAYASMTVAPGKALKLVTTLESGKQYLIVNKVTGAVLTDTETNVTGDSGNKPGLATTGTASTDSKELWTFTAVDGDFYVTQNDKYLAVAGWEAHMYETAVPLTVTSTLDGWLIYDYTTGPALGHYDAGYYLSDNVGSNYVNGALGTSDTTNTYLYWDIYEIVEANTEISFTGNAVGPTTAKVGSTTYYITVEEYILDDEINDSTNGYTVNAELQRSRYNDLINGVAKDLYTDESWPQYEAARKTAYAKLGEVDGTTYATEAEAQAAIAELVKAVDALEAAKAKLVDAETITIHYQLDGTTVLTAEYKVAADATTLTLPEVLVVDKQTYTISEDQSSDDEDEQITIADGVLTLPENDTVVYVAVEKGVVLGDGFVASGDISADGDYVGTGAQIADLVKDDGTAMKITEMTLTTGFSYDLNLASDTTGYTVEWSSDNTNVATVDQNGNVTAVAAGIANVIATVKDANGNVVEVNSIPVTVFTSATTDRVAAVYIEQIIDTTVYCVVNADTDAKAFEVIEGELVYGKFDTTVSDGTATTAFSFFGDPDEAHALVAMTSTNSFGDYYLLHDDDGNLGIGTEYYRLPDNTTGAGYWQAIGLTDNNHDGKADWTKIEAMINWAIANGCDGGMGFTRRQTEGNIGSNLTFISDPMPTIEKEVYGVLPTSRKTVDFRLYTDGMVAAVDELVYFKLTVTLERPTTFTDDAKTLSAITYDEAYVSDTILKGAYLYTKALDQADGVYDGEIDEAYRVQIQEITDELNEPWGADETERTMELYLLYEIQESDIPKFYIDNIAYLNYDYESHYSTGAQAGAADAEARISVVGTAIDNVVIDFGQSFVYQGHNYTSITDGKSYTFEGLSNVHLKGAYVEGENDIAGITASKATAKYGDVKVYRTATGKLDDKGYPEYTYTVTYTPTQILQGVDTVLIYGYGENNREKIINGFMVYPATTVYYEEGFILNNASTWSSAGSEKATVNQTFELLGHSQFDEHGALTGKVSNKKHAYGYDPIYNGDGTNDVAKSSITSSTVGEKTTFTFTGNGFEIFANSKNSTGHVSVQVKNSAGQFVKVFTVNTVASEGYTGVTDGQTVNLDSLPIVSWHTDIHDTYTVTVQKILDTKPVEIDGVRIFNTVDESEYMTEENVANSPFLIDREDNPDFYQLRDHVLLALNIDNDTSVDYRTMCDQVYELMGDGQHAVILDAQNPYNSDAIVNRTVYTRTTTKTTVTTTRFTDGTYLKVTRTDTTLEEYLTEARELKDLLLTRTYTDETTQYFNATGTEVDRAAFGDPATKVIDSEEKGEAVVNTEEGTKTVLTSQDLLDNGPKNELYLHPGERLVFKVRTSRVMQLGLKAPNGETSYTISGASDNPISGALKTSVDMFYELGNAIGTETDYTITVQNTGNKILSVTDLKICDDPNAAFEPLTKEDIASVLQAMGYGASCDAGHTYKDGFCAVCGLGTARNTTTGTEYASVGDALAAAQAGETVIVLTDCTEGTVMVTPGITLDLNGCKLTVSYAVTMDSADIIDTVGTGCLVTGMKSLVLDESNAMIPVYTGEGYVFTSAGFAVRQDTSYTGNGVKIKAMAYPTQMAVVDLLKDGGADNNIEIVIRLTWDTDQGTGSQDFKFSDEVVATVFGSNNGTWNSYGKMFTMVITGTENIENLKATILVVSGTDAEYVSNKTIDIT